MKHRSPQQIFGCTYGHQEVQVTYNIGTEPYKAIFGVGFP